MAIGPREAALRAQREASARKARVGAVRVLAAIEDIAAKALPVSVASPSPERLSLALKQAEAADMASSAVGALGRAFLLQVPVEMEPRLEAERVKRGLRSRAGTIRALLEEALK